MSLNLAGAARTRAIDGSVRTIVEARADLVVIAKIQAILSEASDSMSAIRFDLPLKRTILGVLYQVGDLIDDTAADLLLAAQENAAAALKDAEAAHNEAVLADNTF